MKICEQWDPRIYLRGYLLLLGLIEESPRNETQGRMLDWLGVKNVTSGFILKVVCCYKVLSGATPFLRCHHTLVLNMK